MPIRYRGPHVVTIHDFAPLVTPAAYSAYTPRMFRYTIQLLINQGASFICNSENTRKDFHRFFHVSEERVEVNYLGISPHFRPPADPNSIKNLRTKYQLPDDYFLFIGAMNKRKNLDNLLEAFKKINVESPSTDLVLAGNMEWGGDAVRQKVKILDLESRVHFPGYVREADLPGLIHFSRALVYLSKYEGFGFPVLEGMACGTPVICSNVSSLPEIGGDAAIYVDPDDQPGITKAMEYILSDQDARMTIVKKGLSRAAEFSWESTAQQTLGIYNAILEKRQ
jgi:glycosyltransferase involved in cell wall biosynthesis